MSVGSVHMRKVCTEHVDMRVGCVHVTIGSGLYEGGLCVAPLVCVWVSFLALLTSQLGSQKFSENHGLSLKPGLCCFRACSAYVLTPSRTTYLRVVLLGPPSSLTNQEHAAQICR